MEDVAITAMQRAIESLEDLREKVQCWRTEIETVARVLTILPPEDETHDAE